jgi:hypothetical protein
VIISCREALSNGGFWKSKYMYPNTRMSRWARPIFISCVSLLADTLLTRSRGWRLRNTFWRMGVETDQRWTAGDGVGGRQPGSSAMAIRSLAFVQPFEFRVSPWGDARGNAGRRRVAAGGATRSSDRGPPDLPPPGNPGTEVFGLNISEPDIFCGAATRSESSSSPSPRRY